jgi:dipeptidyl-peptidase 4
MLLLNVALMATTLSPALPSKELTLERIFADPPLEGRTPMALGLSPDGRFFTFLKPNDKDSDVLDLWGAALPDGTPRLVVATADLLAGTEQKLTEAEKMALERKRITKKGITSYLWCGKDSTGLVFPLSGDLYHAAISGDGAKPTVTRLTSDDEPELNPKCSKDGAFIAFTKKGDVFVLDRKSKKARALTKGGSATRTFGLAEFIAEEEMGRHDGLWWSPDSKRVLVMEVDESKVGVKVRAQIFADRTETFEQRYPAAGEANAVVTAWVIDVATGKKTKLQTPTEDGYFPRAGFFQDGAAWIQWQSRDQKKLRLFEANASGVLRPVLEETDAAWVDLHDDLEDLHTVLPGKLLWSSERSGRRQLYVVDRKSGALTALTNEPEPVLRVLAVDDAGTVFYTAARDRGRQAHVLAISVKGGAAKAITTEPGMHTATFDDAGKFFVHRHAKPLPTEGSFGTPPTTTVRDATGKQVMAIDGEVPPELASIAAMPHAFLDLKAEDGAIMNGVLFEPMKREANKKYPVIAYVYGGPTGHMVTKGWGRGMFMTRYWTQRGFGVFFVDNRGMGARDRDFARAHFQRFGDVEVRDLFDATRQMAAQTAWVDAKKLGVFGWSYGGYLAARAALDENTPFSAHVGVAPVTDWSLYDTHYTERYVGMPKLADGKPNDTYTKSNLVTRARLLSKPLLLVHGTADDNVLFEHTLRLTEALQKEGKVFELMIYPGKAHGISGKPAQLHVYRTITTFFETKFNQK